VYKSPAGLLAPHFCGGVKFALVANPHHPQATKKLEALLELVGDAELEEATAQLLGRSGTPLAELSGDLLLALGGDGTLLYALSQLDLPVFGINIGKVGFLTESEFGESLEADLSRLKTGDYEVEELQRLEVCINGLSVGRALNEAVIHTARVAKIQKFRITLDGRLADEFRGDGLIIATPTGSTSYAMSAGSPILHPAVGAHVLVPIAPYRIGSRPLVIPDSVELGIKLLNPRPSVVVLDGGDELAVGPDDEITITKSATPARFARFGDTFFERVQRKLRMQ
jgi:NAD+ kinase